MGQIAESLVCCLYFATAASVPSQASTGKGWETKASTFSKLIRLGFLCLTDPESPR